MSELHVRQIANYLERTYGEIISLDDLDMHDEDVQRQHLFTRALAAFSLQHLAEVQPAEAAGALTEGNDDNGLDAVFYHDSERILFLVQAKWRATGSGSVEVAEVQKFIQGFRDLVNARFERFNAKVGARRESIEEALLDARTRVVLVLAYTGQQNLSSHCRRLVDDLLTEMNDPTELVSVQILRQSNLHSAISEGVAGAPINAQVALSDWGQVRDPYPALYGQIAASDIATLWERNFPRILAPNIRMFLGQTDVNASLMATLHDAPESFWYFNNGITALCSAYRKAPIGGDTRDYAIFDCEDLRVVNGAQTAGAIARAHETNSDSVAKARVPLRIISLEGCPEGFDREVTRNTNTQNRVESRDFVALDPEQQRIATELQIEGIVYSYKSGDTPPAGASGFDLIEATVAQACADRDLQFAVQAKREIGRLWQDISRAPYKRLFNASVSGPELWNKVRYLREIERELTKLGRGASGRRRLVAVHGNRFIEHLVFAELTEGQVDVAAAPSEASLDVAKRLTAKLYEATYRAMELQFGDSYPAALFKNLSRCRLLGDAVTGEIAQEGQT